MSRIKWRTPQEMIKDKSIRGLNGCWEWVGSIKKNGYGRLDNTYYWVKKYPAHTAHRFSYLVHFGEIQNNLFVCHKCNNRKCVNPEHLYLGTHKDNMIDKSNAGSCRGSKNHKAKLNEEQVGKIKVLLKSLTVKEVAKLFSVSLNIIYRIRAKTTWKYVL